MKKIYIAPSVEKVQPWMDQTVLAASGNPNEGQGEYGGTFGKENTTDDDGYPQSFNPWDE